MNEVIVSPKERVVYEKLNPLEDMPINYSVLGLISRNNAKYFIHLIKSVDSDGNVIFLPDEEEDTEVLPEEVLGWVYYPDYNFGRNI